MKKPSNESIELLEGRLESNNPLDFAKKEFKNAPHSFHTRKKRDAYCKNRMIGENKPIFTLNA